MLKRIRILSAGSASSEPQERARGLRRGTPWCRGGSQPLRLADQARGTFSAVAGPGERTYHQAMANTSARSGRNRGRGVSVVLGIILLVIAVVTVLTRRGTVTIPGFGRDDNATPHLTTAQRLLEKATLPGGCTPFFRGQGYTESTFAGSTREGATVERLPAEDPQLQEWTAHHGVPAQGARVATHVMAELGMHPTVHNTLEALVEGVSARCSPAGGPELFPEDEQ